MAPDRLEDLPLHIRPVPLRTVAGPVEWEGTGLHSGAACRVRVTPADGPGLHFVSGATEIPAVAEHVVDTARCTVLGRAGAAVSTVEHLLAALAGLGIWSAVIEVVGPEVPILDGSAEPFVRALLDTGTRLLGTIDAMVPEAAQIRGVGAVRAWAPVSGSPTATFHLTGDHPMLAGQVARMDLDDPQSFAGEIAPCRTWAPIEQVQPLIDRGLIRGGSLENALVVYPDRYSSPLRRESEPARHKLLDLVGDLALVGRPIHAAITAAGGGHTLNVRMAQTLRAAWAADGVP